MTKLRKDRNPRYTKAMELAELNTDLLKVQTSHNYNSRLRLIDLQKKINSLTDELLPRNARLTDAYLKLSHKYWGLLEVLRTRNSRVELLKKELKNYVPDHWLFAEEETDDEEDNASEESDPNQLEEDFDTDNLKPN